MSQELLAEKMQVSRQAVTKWENNQSAPSAQKLIQLAQLFDISFEELVGDREDNAEHKVSPWPFRSCLAATILFLFLLAGTVYLYISSSPPDNIIGYADRATDIYVNGPPVLPIFLGCLTALSGLLTVFFLVKKKNKERK